MERYLKKSRKLKEQVVFLPVCKRCGCEVPDGAAFCPKCGASIVSHARIERGKRRVEPTPSWRLELMRLVEEALKESEGEKS